MIFFPNDFRGCTKLRFLAHQLSLRVLCDIFVAFFNSLTFFRVVKNLLLDLLNFSYDSYHNNHNQGLI